MDYVYVRFPGKVSKSADSFNSKQKKFFFTQVFNLIVQKRLRPPNSKCACATAKRFGMLKETYRKGGLYLNGYSASTSFFKQILKLIIT